MLKKIVLTGAAGRLGGYLRKPLAAKCETLVSTDIAPLTDPLIKGESFVQADLADYAKMSEIIKGADMVVHFGGHPDEKPFEDILHANIIGCYNIWQAAHEAGVRRIVYASSIHAVGLHPKTTAINIHTPHRPDSYYGLAKCFAEDMAKLYWDKKGLEAVCLRILSCANVTNSRALGSWLSYDDLIHLVERAVDTPTTGFAVIYGVSNNDRSPVDNSGASFLGYRPRDNAEQFAEDILANAPEPDPRDPDQMMHGGPFATTDLGESGVAKLGLSPDDN
ncbi:MAG: NAD(P)-dependent oxidoreductase [Proteobacteria bacterium]|nr:NAD(P)-dependent oxidoreductase [Pseudomonadota bacterium]